MAKPPYTRQRVHYADGAWADVCIARFPADALHFEDIILRDVRVRMRDAARLRFYKAIARGEADPLVIPWAALETDRAAAQVFPGVDTTTDEGEHLLSVNSLVTCTLRTLLAREWLRREAGAWRAEVPPAFSHWRTRANAVLNWLTSENRLGLEAGPERQPPARLAFEGFDPLLNLIPVGRCGFVRDVVRERLPAVAFTTSFFLLEHDDFLSHHSMLGDPYGLMVRDGEIIRPPLYRRSTVWRGSDGRWQVGRLGMQDMRLTLPSGTIPRFAVNPANASDIALYTRYFGVEAQGRVLGHTPTAPGRLELTIVDRRVVGWKWGGGLLIPQNGFVLSFAADALPEDRLQTILAVGRIAYSFAHAEHQGIDRALQCGPRLIQDGRSVLTPEVFTDEQYWVSRESEDGYIVGVVPSEYPDDIDRTRAARIGLGIGAGGGLLVVAVDGSSKDIAVTGRDSVGATLAELTGQLLAAGAVEAINLDGGGSTQLFVEGGLFNRPGDQRGRPGVLYERMVPSIGVVP